MIDPLYAKPIGKVYYDGSGNLRVDVLYSPPEENSRMISLTLNEFNGHFAEKLAQLEKRVERALPYASPEKIKEYEEALGHCKRILDSLDELANGSDTLPKNC